MGEILGLDLFVILNKVDLISKDRAKKIMKFKRQLRKVISKSNFRNRKSFDIIEFSALNYLKDEQEQQPKLELISKLIENVHNVQRD